MGYASSVCGEMVRDGKSANCRKAYDQQWCRVSCKAETETDCRFDLSK